MLRVDKDNYLLRGGGFLSLSQVLAEELRSRRTQIIEYCMWCMCDPEPEHHEIEPAWLKVLRDEREADRQVIEQAVDRMLKNISFKVRS